MAQPKSFETTIIKGGDGRVYLPLPFDPDGVWGVVRPHRLHGMLDGKNFRGVVEAIEGGFGLPIGPMWQKDCGVAVGQTVQAVLKPEGPRREDLDADLAAALAAEPEAGVFFDGLAQFYRKGYLRWIDGAKRRPDVRAARISELVDLLKAGVKQRP